MSMWNAPQHSYEEIREMVVEILQRPPTQGRYPEQFTSLVTEVRNQFGLREAGRSFDPNFAAALHPYDAELVRDVFWDLFRQGVITLGRDSSMNAGWPWFQLSHFGESALRSTQSPYRFHDVRSYLSIVRSKIPDVSTEAVVYLEEAIAAFYADCLLAAVVMLGVAAETEFLHLLDVAAHSKTHGATFSPLLRVFAIHPKIKAFRHALAPLKSALQPKKDFEDLDTNLDLIQSVLRIARNSAGHPTGKPAPSREQTYIYIQLFVPFAAQLMALRRALS